MSNKPLGVISALLVLLLTTAGSRAQTLDIDSLGALDLVFEAVTTVQMYPGQPVAAEVSFRKGEAFIVPSPGRVQQIEYLVAAGATVEQGQAFAVLRGPEMHHFEMSYRSSKEILAGAERRFNSNKLLYKRKTISEGQWLEISEKYYLSLLEYEHMRHFFELVVSTDEEADALTLGAPLAGIIDYSAAYGGVAEGESVASFIPQQAIRLEASIPTGMRGDVARLRVGDCELGIERTSGIATGFFVQVWSESLPPDCPLLLGQQVLATPLLQADAYGVPRTAVFQLQQQPHVLLRAGATLTPVAVTLLGAEGDRYLLSCPESLRNQQVLVTSVSAVQGILLGLGGE